MYWLQRAAQLRYIRTLHSCSATLQQRQLLAACCLRCCDAITDAIGLRRAAGFGVYASHSTCTSFRSSAKLAPPKTTATGRGDAGNDDDAIACELGGWGSCPGRFHSVIS
jgi:hypothetical protein